MRLIHGILASLFPPRPEPIAELRAGVRATVRGVLVPRDQIDSPLTEDRCVYYQYTVEEWRRSQVVGIGSDGFWEVIEHDAAIVEFYVQDDTGRAIVSPERVNVERGRRIGVQHVEFGINRRAQQLLLMAGDTVEISGEVERVIDVFDEARGFRASPERLLLRAPASDTLEIRLLARGAGLGDAAGKLGA